MSCVRTPTCHVSDIKYEPGNPDARVPISTPPPLPTQMAKSTVCGARSADAAYDQRAWSHKAKSRKYWHMSLKEQFPIISYR